MQSEALWADSENSTFRRQHLPPCFDKPFVSPAHLSDIAVKITQPQRIHTAIVFSQSCVPVNLILKTVPGESDDWHAVLFQLVNVGPFLRQPLHAVLPAEPVRFRVHDGEPVT